VRRARAFATTFEKPEENEYFDQRSGLADTTKKVLTAWTQKRAMVVKKSTCCLREQDGKALAANCGVASSLSRVDVEQLAHV
jgi:hypothetical protein